MECVLRMARNIMLDKMTLEEQEKHREERRIRYEAAKHRMAVARRLRVLEKKRLKKQLKSEKQRLEARTRINLVECQQKARATIATQVLRILESRDKKKKEKMTMAIMEKQLLKALGIDEKTGLMEKSKKEVAVVKAPEVVPPEVELEIATSEIIDDNNNNLFFE